MLTALRELAVRRMFSLLCYLKDSTTGNPSCQVEILEFVIFPLNNLFPDGENHSEKFCHQPARTSAFTTPLVPDRSWRKSSRAMRISSVSALTVTRAQPPVGMV